MTAPRVESRPGVWQCESNFIVCQHDHLMLMYKAGFAEDRRRLNGHSFLFCRECQPTSYFFAHFVTLPYPMATCYAISKESFDEWANGDDLTLNTPELLYRLRDPKGQSLKPNWRPQR